MKKVDTQDRIKNARVAVSGVSTGDAFGESFFGENDKIKKLINAREIPPTTWEFTDDTVMTIAILEELETDGEIDQDRLIRKFCVNHNLDPNRGYGATLRRILREVEEGQSWKNVSKNAFDGQGSMGNGAAMRVCPIGAFHFDNLQKVKELAIKSAEITHFNMEAITGAIAIAIGTALTTKMKSGDHILTPIEFIDSILNELPDSDTKSGIAKSKSVSPGYTMETIKTILGNGTNMTAQDTVPFVTWCAAHHLDNFEEALWHAVSVLGDRDTICAMVGGMTIMSSKQENIPAAWMASVESFEKSAFRNSAL